MTLLNLDPLINIPTCFQSEKFTCTDLILTKKKGFFKWYITFEVEISDHHHQVITSMRNQHIQGYPKIRLFQEAINDNFWIFNNELNEWTLKNWRKINYWFLTIIFLNPHAPMKIKIQRFNNNPFMTKRFCNAKL